MYAPLEVAVAREHCAGSQVARLDGRGDLRLQRAAISDAIMHRNISRYESVQSIDRKVEHRVHPGGTHIGDLQTESGQCQRILRDAIAFGAARCFTRLKARKPFARTDLPEELDRGGEVAALAMQGLEARRGGLGQAVETVMTFEQRVVWEQRGLSRHQLSGCDTACLLKAEAVILMQRFDAIRHPQALPVDRIDGSPVHRCGTGAQRLVDAVAEANALNEGETLGQNEA